MEKLSKSMKIVLISAISVVCILGIVLGCVFGFKKNNPNNPKVEKLSQYDLLGKEIEKYDNILTDSHITTDVPFEGICDIEDIRDIKDNYFVYTKKVGNYDYDMICLYKKQGSGYIHKILTDPQSSDFVDADSTKIVIEAYNDKYVVISSNFDDDYYDNNNKIIRIISISDFDNVKQVFEFDAKGKEYHFDGVDVSLQNDIFSFYYIHDILGEQTAKLDIVFAYLNDSQYIELTEDNYVKDINIDVEHEYKYLVTDRFIAFHNTDRLIIVSKNNGSFIEKNIQCEKNIFGDYRYDIGFYALSDDQILIEWSEETSYSQRDQNTRYICEEREDGSLYVNYKYQTVGVVNNEITFKDYNLDPDCYKIRNVVVLGDFYYISQKKYDNNFKEKDEYTFRYVNKNQESLFFYDTKDYNDKILLLKDNCFVTNSNFYKLNSGNVELLRDLTDYTVSKSVYETGLIVCQNDINYELLMFNTKNEEIDTLSEMILETSIYENNGILFISVTDNITEEVISTSKYLFNTNDNTLQVVSDYFDYDLTEYNFDFKDFGYYVTKYDSLYSLKTFDGLTAVERFDSFGVSSETYDGAYFVFYLDGKITQFLNINSYGRSSTSKRQNIEDESLSLYDVNDYGSQSKSFNHGSISQSHDGRSYTFTISMDTGYFLRSIDFKYDWTNAYWEGFSGAGWDSDTSSMWCTGPSQACKDHVSFGTGYLSGTQYYYKGTGHNSSWINTYAGFTSDNISSDVGECKLRVYYNYYTAHDVSTAVVDYVRYYSSYTSKSKPGSDGKGYEGSSLSGYCLNFSHYHANWSPTYDVVLTCKWSPETFYITLNLNKPSASSYDPSVPNTSFLLKFDNSSPSSLPTPTMQGWKCVGWSKTKNGEIAYRCGANVNSSDTNTFYYASTSDRVLYAIWINCIFTVKLDYNWSGSGTGETYYNPNRSSSGLNNNYTLTSRDNIYYYFGGNPQNSNNYWYSDKSAKSSISSIPLPTRLGYTFSGYYYEGTQVINGSGTFVNKGTITTKYSADGELDRKYNAGVTITVYAKWSKKNYNVELSFFIEDDKSAHTQKAFIYDETGEGYISYEQLYYIGKNPFTAATSEEFVFTKNPTNPTPSIYFNNTTYITNKTFSIDPTPTTIETMFSTLKNESAYYFGTNTFYIKNSPYRHIGWVLYNPQKIDSDGPYYYFLYDNARTVENSNSSSKLDKIDIEGYLYKLDAAYSTKIYICALYEVRDYEIGLSVENTSGASISTNDGTVNDVRIRDVYSKFRFEFNGSSYYDHGYYYGYKHKNVETSPKQLKFDNSGANVASVDSNKKVIFPGEKFTADAGSEVVFHIKLFDEENKPSYTFSRIVLRDIYCAGSRRTVTFTYNVGKNNFTVDGSYYKVEGPDKNITGTSFVLSSGEIYNKISFDMSTDSEVTIKISNVFYGLGSTGGNDETKYSTKKGFDFEVYAKPAPEGLLALNTTSSGTTQAYSAAGMMPSGAYAIVPVAKIDSQNKKFYYWLNGNFEDASYSSTTIPVIMKDDATQAYILKNRGDTGSTNPSDYLVYIPIKNISAAGYANTQVLLLQPEHKSLYGSEGTNRLENTNTNYYQPTGYLSQLTIGAVTYSLTLTKRTGSGIYSDKPHIEISSSTANSFVSADVYENNYTSIFYNGDFYEFIECYDLNVDNSNEYRLYLGYNNSTKKIIYYLVANGKQRSEDGVLNLGNLTQVSVTYIISDYTNSIKINQTNNNLNVVTSNIHNFYDGNTEIKNYSREGNNFVYNNFTPASGVIFRITPTPGYLINTISIKIGNDTLVDLRLNAKIGGYFDYEGGQNTKKDFDHIIGLSLVAGQLDGDEAGKILLTYDSGSIRNINASIATNNTKYGFYYAGEADTGIWSEQTGNSFNFESLYLLFTGIYDSVNINVTTISYFEFDFKMSDILDLDDFEDYFHFAYYKNNKYNAITKSVDAMGNIVIGSDGKSFSVQKDTQHDNVVIYRAIFLGYLEDSANGFAFFVSGQNYSFAFNNPKFYYHSDITQVNSNFFKSASSQYLASGQNIIYFETNGNSGNALQKFFSGTSGHNLQIQGTTNINDGRIYSEKYSCLFDLKTNDITMTPESMITGKGAGTSTDGWAIDDMQKTDTWFNDICVTNIDFAYSGRLNNASSRSELKFFNWQDLFGGTDKPLDFNTGGVISDGIQKTIFGYGIKLTYYVIPGYYLYEIVIQVGGKICRVRYSDTEANKDNSGFGVTYSDLPGMKVYVKEVTDNNYGVVAYELYLYPPESETATFDFEGVKNNLSILVQDFSVITYSQAYGIDISFDENIANGQIINGNSELPDFNTIDFAHLTYGIIAEVPYSASNSKEDISMTGYTLVGWGSQNYFDGTAANIKPRAFVQKIDDTHQINLWNSSSNWINIYDYFNHDVTKDVDGHTIYQQRSNLLGLHGTTVNTAEFYPLGSYFITDTGFATRSSRGTGRNQTYNFLTSHLQTDFTINKKVDEFSKAFTYQTTLYAVWKPNTYYVSFDVNAADTNNKEVSNGSTNAQLSKLENGVPAGFANITSSIIIPNYIETNSSRLQYNNISYDVYVVYDTNLWYMLNSTSEFSVKSGYSLYEDGSDPYLFQKQNNEFTQVIDFSKFIIDRYGYTWLGWFAEKLTNVYEKSDYYNSGTYPTAEIKKDSSDKVKIYGTNTYDNSSTTLGTFNEMNYPALFNSSFDNITGKNVSNVKEIPTNNHFNYYREMYRDETSSVLAERYGLSAKGASGNDDKTDDPDHKYVQSGDVYFYKYSEQSNDDKDNKLEVIMADSSIQLKVSEDYLNKYKNDGVLYYDTVRDFRYYDFDYNISGSQKGHTNFFWYKGEGVGDVVTHDPTFRYITLYAYWQTNLYNVNVEFRDAINDGIAPVFGSSKVERTDKPFMPVYFDDESFAKNRLNTFLPIRVGYDFLGWTFAPNSTEKELVNFELDSAKTNIWLDGNTINYLYSSKVDEYTNLVCQGESSDSNGYAEKLGDTETEHYVYMFAIWQVQTFSINISLNIDANRLQNLYDYDSEFALALYTWTRDTISGYKGYDVNNLLQHNSGEFAFTNIAANIEFTINFDQKLSEAYFKFGGQTYYLKDLFATSAGYYFTGWFIDPECTNVLVENTTDSSFDAAGALISALGNSRLSGVSKITEDEFNFDYYKKLVTSTYEEKTADNQYQVHTQKLYSESGSAQQALDFYTAKQKYTPNDTATYRTLIDFSNKSSNFGYLTIPSGSSSATYYIKVGYRESSGQRTYYMYFVDNTGKKGYLVPYIKSGDKVTNIANVINDSGRLEFTYDETGFYFNGNLVKFTNQGTAYYVDRTYGDKKEIDIMLAYSETESNNFQTANIMDAVIAQKFPGTKIFYIKTRQFTIFAGWKLKQDLSLSITNGNIGSGDDPSEKNFVIPEGSEVDENQTSDANYGLAGYYNIKSTGGVNSSQSSPNQTKQTINLGYNFYDDLSLFIAPYYNGRYLSQISFEFFAYEQETDQTGSIVFKKIRYVFTLNFNWDSTNHILDLSDWSVTRNGELKASKSMTLTAGYVQNANSQDTANGNAIKNDISVESIGILSLLDQTVFSRTENGETKSKFMEISSYAYDFLNYAGIDTSNFVIPSSRATKSNGEYGRTDLNYSRIYFNDLMTSVNINCRFAVQTYNLEVYNVFDSLGNTLEPLSDSNNFKVAYNEFRTFISNSKSVITASGSTSYPEVAFGNTVKQTTFSGGTTVATIPTNVAPEGQTNTYGFNVPYGYYIYGQYFSANNRPVGVAYDPVTKVGFNDSVYSGYGYIYETGIYHYGSTINLIQNNHVDASSDQCTPILGSKTLFAKSIRETSSLYSFVSWYTPVFNEDSTFELAEYGQNQEATRIAQNITLVGYYFANNKPTSLEFYTWNDSTNAYEKYTQNIEEYTLQSNGNSFKYIAPNTELERDSQISDGFVTEDGKMILLTNESFGVDVASFGTGSSVYTMSEVMNNAENKAFLEDNVIRNYWFYQYCYTYVEVKIGAINHYIRYDSAGKFVNGTKSGGKELYFYYLINEKEADTESNRKYVQLFSDSLNDDSFLIYINVNTDDYVVTISSDNTLSQVLANHDIGLINATITKYYSYDLRGSDMYARETANRQIEGDIDKYYPIKKVEDYDSDDTLTSDEKELMKSFFTYDSKQNRYTYSAVSARFYVKIAGTVYYLIATTSSENYTVTTFYVYSNENYRSSGLSYPITKNGSNYTITVDGNSVPVKAVADYQNDKEVLTGNERVQVQKFVESANASRAKYYTKVNSKIYYIENVSGSTAELFEYTPAGFVDSSKPFTIHNIDYYYLQDEEKNFYPVKYEVREDTSGAKYINPYKILNVCNYKGTEYYFNYENKTFYTDSTLTNRLSVNVIKHKAYTPVNDNYSVKLALPENPTLSDIWEYYGVTINSLPSPNIGFWYNNNSYAYVGYVDFKQSDLSYISSTVVKSEFSYSDGKERIYDVFEEYIGIVHPELLGNEDIFDQIKSLCSSYGDITKLKETLITVDKFYTAKGSNSVDQIDLIIPVTFELQYGKETISATISIRYKTTIITKTTTIDETIYAIPIYSRNVMEFTDSGNNSQKSIKQLGSVLTITPDNMYVVYFENIGNIDTRYYNKDDGNYLKFAVLNETQYGLLKGSLNYPDELTYLLNKYSSEIKVFSEYDEYTAFLSDDVEIDFADYEDGTYYIVAYYTKMDGYNYVVRTSDNIVKVDVSSEDVGMSVKWKLV